MKKQVQSSPLLYLITTSELNQSRNFWVKAVQAEWFAIEIKLIARKKTLLKSNHLTNLTPFLDREGLLRVGSRLQNASIDSEAKHPLIFPSQSPLTSLIVDKAHQRRQKSCEITYSQMRTLRSLSSNTSLDYAGPVTLKIWRGRAARCYKSYLAIFICLVTSAIHIEGVTDYTTDAFIADYKRFSGRRGICVTIQSDCGTNFIEADAELRRLFNEFLEEILKIANILANDGTH
ncbi:uncharacterized protein [Cardiocondyla obscurior]|uniref:uncharacterized protein n=1 Tax=Cardiocondyla obscurior TaxID=286306 RepID=UPI00396572B2